MFLFLSTEKFGNRDYILTIDYASMNDDAEYTVSARNVAGEVKLSAQVIVEPQSGKMTRFDMCVEVECFVSLLYLLVCLVHNHSFKSLFLGLIVGS